MSILIKLSSNSLVARLNALRTERVMALGIPPPGGAHTISIDGRPASADFSSPIS